MADFHATKYIFINFVAKSINRVELLFINAQVKRDVIIS